MSKFIGYWDDLESMKQNFEQRSYLQKVDSEECDVTEEEVIAAVYGDSFGYSGSAHVFFERGGKVFEVYGSHCSCDGLEGQWEPDEVSIEHVRAQGKNLSAFSDVEDEFQEPFRKLLSDWAGR